MAPSLCECYKKNSQCHSCRFFAPKSKQAKDI
jgi:hypothetical protein